MRRAAIAWIVALLAAAAAAQEPGQVRTVQVAVTSVSGRSVYLDRGRADGLAPGTVVRLSPPGALQVDVEVRVVSSHSARAELPPGWPSPPVGTRGEAAVAAPPPQPTAQPAAPAEPGHAPWLRQEDPRQEDQPLLVPTYGQRPEERPMLLHGRVYSFGQWNQDRGAGRNADYLLARLGADIEATNPFGNGGVVRAIAELDTRSADVASGIDESDTRLRLETLSYSVGEDGGFGADLGRFWSRSVPELGLVDGVELAVRNANGWRLGAGLGSYPLPFPDHGTGEDLGFHLFADYESGTDRAFATGVAVQKTWHEGEPDRDLLVLRVEGRPGEGWWYWASAKLDYYTGGDTLKGQGLEVTEILAQARWDGQDLGVGALASHFTWPELERREYQDLPDELVTDGVVDRVSGSAWVRPLPDLRLSARADLWRDQDDDGTAFEIAGDVQDLFGSGAWLYLAWLQTDGSNTSGPGARARVRLPLGGFRTSVGWQYLRYDIEGLLTGTESSTRESVDFGLDWTVGALDLSLLAERWFGDQEDAFALGLYAQYRF